MVKMVAFWMCKLSPAEVATSDAFDSNRSAFRKALTLDRARKVGRAIASRRALRVLVVDDDQDAADALDRLVRRWGHAARLAYDGRTGLKVAAAQHPDVVLLAMEMRLLEGCQVARQLRRDFPRKECFIIAVTEFGDDQRRRQYSEAGIDLVLIKPVDPSVLETLLMLECVRMNRSQTDSTAGLAREGSPQHARKEPTVEKRDGAAKPSRARKTAGAGTRQQP
jgi:CheY-like chemotaxis protein